MLAWLEKLRGRFIVFDGPDGSGKSTQLRRFCRYAQQSGLEICEVREPGGTAIGEQIRQVLLDPAHEPMDLSCEMLLYMASRAQLVADRIAPAMHRGSLVVADRFISSTLAYQGTAGGLSTDDILAIGRIALRQYWPDLVVIFDIDDRSAAGRLNPLLDRMEQKGTKYHHRVRRGFLDQAAYDPDHHRVIDATVGQDVVFECLMSTLKSWSDDLE